MSFVRHSLVIVATVLLSASSASAQLQWSKWLFGFRAGLDFAEPVLRLIPGSALRTLEGSASVADPRTGELLFYTDGRTVWNRLHVPMQNGVGLLGHASSTQSALIVPDPGSPTRYYLFATDAYEDLLPGGGTYDGLTYSIVDMTLNGGFGDVTEKNTRLEPAIVAEKLCGIRSCNNGTYWVITHEADQNTFYAYHITASGISSPVISRGGSVHKVNSAQPRRVSDLPGCIKSSADGARIAVVQGGSGPEIFDFDQATGQLTVALRLDPTDPHLYGVSFSPDGSRLYALQNIVGGSLVQYDLTAGTSAQVSATRVVLAQYATSGGTLQLAPDGRIYVAIESRDALDVITEPNRRGAACRLMSGLVGLGGAIVGWGLPNIIESELGLAPRPYAEGDTVICPGDSARLSINGGVRHRWTPSSSLSCADCPSPIARPDSTTRYVVATTSATGCITTDTVVVAVHDAASIDAGDPRAICIGDTVSLTVNGGVRWEWSPSTGLSCDDCASPRAFPTRTTTYSVVAYSAGGCVAVDTVRVAVNSIPRVVARGDTTVCANEPVSLRASGAATYRWLPADGLSCSDCPDPVAIISDSRVIRVIGTSADGCSAEDSVVVTITPTELVRASVDSSIRATVGGTVEVPVIIDRPDALRQDGSLELDVTYDATLLRLNGISALGTLAENGEAVLLSQSSGVRRYRLRPGPRDNDTLIRLIFRAFFGDSLVSPIGIAFRPTGRCMTIAARGGTVRIDSICGWQMRLMVAAEPFALRAAQPNPFDASTRLEFSTTVSSHVRMRVVDVAGIEVLRPVDRWLDAGRHALVLEGGRLPRGSYTVIVDAGGATASARIVRR